MAINIPIVTEFADKGLKSAEAAFANFKTKVSEADGAMGKMKAGFGAATDYIEANSKVIATAGITAFAAFGAKAISAASDFEESTTKIQKIFGDSSEAVMAFAEDADKALGQSKQSVLDAAGVFGTFGKAAGLAGDDLATFTTDFVALSSDLASFNNTSPEEAIQAIGAALRGESEPLRKYGILLDDATLKAEALSLGIYDGNGALTSQQKILAAQSAIYKQSKDAQGDFARTSDGLANQQRILQASLQNVTIEIGQKLLPAALEFANFANDNLIPIVETLADSFSLLTIGTKSAREMTDKLPASLDAAGAQYGFFQGLIRSAGEALGILDEKVDHSKDKYKELNSSLGENRKALQDARRETSRLSQAVQSLDDDTNGLIDTWDEALSRFSQKAAFNDVRDSIDAVREAVIKAFEEKTPEAMRAAEEAVGDLYKEVGDYIQLLGDIPLEKQTEILAALDMGDYDKVMRLLDELARDRTSTIRVRTVGGSNVRPGDTPSETRGTGVTIVDPSTGQSHYLPPGIDFGALARGGGQRGVTNLSVNVAGSVTSERDLVETIRRGLVSAQRNGSNLVYNNV